MRFRVAAVYLCLLFAPFGMFSLVWAFIYFARAEYLSGLVALGFGLFAGGFVVMLLVVAGKRTIPRATSDDAGTTFRPDFKVDGFLTISSVAVFFGMLVYAIFAPQGMLVIPVPSGNQRQYVYACIAGVLVGLPSMWQIVKQRGMSRLRMTTKGIEVGGAVSTKRHTWDELTDIADRPRNGHRSTGTTYIMTANGHTRTLPSDWYTPGGRVLRELVQFYWEHPEARAELVDGRAESRFKAECRGTT
ncbi:hypothetical protein ACIA48_21760 [Mycobacterium sp. NPDC051804]|uniref:hypothetical protein n=1 Tax=Mycobacterium sp. NPDC051804 TaxID=3364295 RepID=UPI003789AF73